MYLHLWKNKLLCLHWCTYCNWNNTCKHCIFFVLHSTYEFVNRQSVSKKHMHTAGFWSSFPHRRVCQSMSPFDCFEVPTPAFKSPLKTGFQKHTPLVTNQSHPHYYINTHYWYGRTQLYHPWLAPQDGSPELVYKPHKKKVNIYIYVYLYIRIYIQDYTGIYVCIDYKQ